MDNGSMIFKNWIIHSKLLNEHSVNHGNIYDHLVMGGVSCSSQRNVTKINSPQVSPPCHELSAVLANVLPLSYRSHRWRKVFDWVWQHVGTHTRKPVSNSKAVFGQYGVAPCWLWPCFGCSVQTIELVEDSCTHGQLFCLSIFCHW